MAEFKRKLEEKLNNWRHSANRKPLVIRGARQVGKTTLIRRFGKQFDTFIELNLEKSEDLSLFQRSLNAADLIQYICLTKNIKRNGETLLFIDEIQNSPEAVKMLRYFYEEIPDIYVISAGSLLEIMMDKHKISFPVGRVEYRYLFPLSFEEFLWAVGETQLAEYYNQIPIPIIAHEPLMKMFRLYTFIGGMPEAVSRYRDTRDLSLLSDIYAGLVTSFQDDTGKYASNRHEEQIIRHVIETAPAECTNRITFQNFGNSGFSSKDVGNALRTLERAMLVYLRYPITSPTLPLLPDLKLKPHLQILDSGLLCHSVGITSLYYDEQSSSDTYNGRLAEQIVGQELLATNSDFELRKPAFWTREKKQSNSEIDFIFVDKGRVYPIEVKSGSTGKLRSLHSYINNSEASFAIRLYSGEYSVDNLVTPIVGDTGGKPYTLLNLPLYCAGKIGEYVDMMKNLTVSP
ncbi:MAG: ATP-binding protein [Spirochaetales bacterium]|nr:ATP-binding protein [Spirochaetales bacterium]